MIDKYFKFSGVRYEIMERIDELKDSVIIEPNIKLDNGMLLEVDGINSDIETEELLCKLKNELSNKSKRKILFYSQLMNSDIVEPIGRTLIDGFNKYSTKDLKRLNRIINKKIDILEDTINFNKDIIKYFYNMYDLYIILTDNGISNEYITSLLTKNKKVILTYKGFNKIEDKNDNENIEMHFDNYNRFHFKLTKHLTEDNGIINE